MKVEAFKAVRGKDVPLNSLKLGYRASKAILYKQKTGTYDLDSVGNLGCYLSHLSLWKRIAALQSESPVLILEDDCQFMKDPTEVLQTLQKGGIEAAWLGSDASVEGSVTIADQTFGLLKAWTRGGKDAWGSHAYLITPRIAKLLVEGSATIDLSPDFYIQARLAELNIPLLHMKLATQSAFWKGPDIVHPALPHEQAAKMKGMVLGIILTFSVMLLLVYLYPKIA